MRIILVDGKGRERELEAVEGWRVMEIIRDHGFPIVAECGGACACGTCQVEVDPQWAAKLHQPREDELDMLDRNYGGEWSRLACQLIMTPELDGLRVRLAGIAVREAA
ncbi:MAG: 2Fe-2S iron-sulfur cluster-binding protein [Parvibaculum sp.]|uniref:2Fe-2S iron-sulfur cluster-binding protein n=1 Tax=Parvibaculum sp. TaxID=2024848 RepID=UPI002ABA4EBC|nr:2Fe-2S iron-sulfur cluster-binding protein [Parvibaculum sp.]MDZ4382377.1 2Fe-2S iron-sulfur cluster-binding protein [Parvibaculum sp.]